MDIYLFGIIILTIGSLVIATLVMYQQTLTHRDTISTLERSVEAKIATIVVLKEDLDAMYQCHVSETNPWELAEELTSQLKASQARLESSQTMRRLQASHIAELREEIQRIEDELTTLDI